MEKVAESNKLDINNVIYNEDYSMIAGSPAQIVCGLHDMIEKIDIGDINKKDLYEKIEKLSNKIILKFSDMLKYKSDVDKEIKEINYFGKGGRVKSHNGRYPFIPNINPKIKYKNANFGYYIKILEHRFTFLSTRNMPMKFTTDEEKESFNMLKNDCSEFVKFLNSDIKVEWNNFLDEFKNNKSNDGFVVYHKKKYNNKNVRK